MQNSIFLSHKSTDKETVRLYYSALKAAGFSPWLDDENMHAGDQLDRGILDGFKESCAVVFFLTPSFKDELFLAAEINHARRQEREKGGRFRIIPLIVPGTGLDREAVPELLRDYVWIQEDNHLASFTKLVAALPIRLGSPAWTMEPSEQQLDNSLGSVKGKIESPTEAAVVAPEWCGVSGSVSGYDGQALYLFTGTSRRFWPSPKITPDPEGHWNGHVNLGHKDKDHTIRLAAVDADMERYIETYRQLADKVGDYKGMEIDRFPYCLDRINVSIELPN
jgi:hypothetical protein